MYVEDLADAMIFMLENINARDLYENGISQLNVGTGQDLTIADLASIISEVVGFNGRIEYDSTKPDGTPRKLMDVSRINSLGWKYKTELKDGIVQTYKWYLENTK